MPRNPLTMEEHFIRRMYPRRGPSHDERVWVREWILDLGTRLSDLDTRLARERLRSLFGRTFWGLLKPDVGSDSQVFLHYDSNHHLVLLKARFEFVLQCCLNLRDGLTACSQPRVAEKVMVHYEVLELLRQELLHEGQCPPSIWDFRPFSVASLARAYKSGLRKLSHIVWVWCGRKDLLELLEELSEQADRHLHSPPEPAPGTDPVSSLEEEFFRRTQSLRRGSRR